MMRFSITPWLGAGCLAAAIGNVAVTRQTSENVGLTSGSHTAAHHRILDGDLAETQIAPPSRTRSSRKDYSMATRLKVNVEKVIYLGGQVRTSGPYPLTSGMTLYAAIQSAGGATEFGSLKRVKLFRGENQKIYDLTTSPGMRIPLIAQDTIEVPQKMILGN
jgi:hypothetical protein